MKDSWFTGSGELISTDMMFEIIDDYLCRDGRVFVGTDSQLNNTSCIFATAICLHGAKGSQGGRYFFKKLNKKNSSYKVLRHRILQEVKHSIDVSFELLEKYPDADIEVHVDIGQTPRSATRVFVDTVSGWLSGVGFECRIKPYSWASSSIADCHTK
jgi:predicted RNase H-related nuclease YkuK (DUF458 family)